MAIKRIKCEDHTGREFASVAEMCLFWGISQQLYSSRLRAGWSVEEALTRPKAWNKYEKYFKTKCEKDGRINQSDIGKKFKSGLGVSRKDDIQKARGNVKWVNSHKFSEV